MKCPNCKQKIDYGYSNCPNCNYNVSFSTKPNESKNYLNVRDNVFEVFNTLKIGLVIGVLLTFILIFLFLYLFPFSESVYFNGIFRLIHNILNYMLISGIIVFIVCVLLLILKKGFKLLKYIWIVSIILICIPLLCKKIINVDGSFSLKDYSKVEYIEIGDEKIPSLYSVVGFKNIVLSDESSDNFDEGLNLITDNIALLYADLSNDDKSKYGDALIDYGFSLESIYNTDESKYIQLYMKNSDSENVFYVVSIDGLSIVYTKADGRYQDILE